VVMTVTVINMLISIFIFFGFILMHPYIPVNLTPAVAAWVNWRLFCCAARKR
jgi:membrane-associated protease RseP (regulator of RpoE activity)